MSIHPGMIQTELIIRDLAQVNYVDCWQLMKDFTLQRSPTQTDELWIVEHPPVFTLGVAGKRKHLLSHAHSIPVVESDRGGQITYHGPGQLILYPLLNIQRHGINVKELVKKLEKCVIQTLNHYQLTAHTQTGAPGVYIDKKKIASIGLRVKKGCCYHGLSLNVNMNLTPFSYVNPCGYEGLAICQIKDFVPDVNIDSVKKQIIHDFREEFGYTVRTFDQ